MKKEATQKVIKIDLNEIKITDLNELVYTIENFVKDLANEIYKGGTIEIHDIARSLHKGETVEIEQQDLVDIITITNGLQWQPWIKEQIVKYFKDKLN